MGQALVTNNAFSTLASNITAVATSITVSPGTGIRFPTISLGSNDYFYLSIINTSNQIEIVKVLSTSTDVFTVLRGQDGTTARAYVATDRVELRPTAGLLNDKLSLGGGTLTGHLSTVASASGTQVPQVQEVVKKSGDTMSGILTVPELRGPTNEITIPSGHRIRGAVAGSFVAPGMVIQTVYKQVNTITSIGAAAGTPADVEDMFLAITPKYNTSRIWVTFDICCETANHNMVFRLTRNGGSIGNNNTVSLQNWVGWKVGLFDSNESTTPQQRFMTFLDSPATTSSVTYQLQFLGSSTVACTLYLNRSVAGTAVGQNDYEIGTSSVMLMEIAQ